MEHEFYRLYQMAEHLILHAKRRGGDRSWMHGALREMQDQINTVREYGGENRALEQIEVLIEAVKTELDKEKA